MVKTKRLKIIMCSIFTVGKMLPFVFENRKLPLSQMLFLFFFFFSPLGGDGIFFSKATKSMN